MAKRRHESAKLRHTIEIARLSGFTYEPKRGRIYKYGGVFTVRQLEAIENKLKELELILRERDQNGGSQ